MTLPIEIQEKRLKGIGGSEVSAILGLDRFSSPYKVWLKKTGREKPEPENKNMKAGIRLEGAVADWFADETHHKIVKSSAKPQLFQHPTYPFAIGTPDRFYIAKKKVGRGVLECKTTQMSLDDAIVPWFIQLQWYLGVTGSLYGGIAWLERGVDFKFKEYTFNQEYFDHLIEKVDYFWNENILKDVPPDPVSLEDLQILYGRSAEGKTIEANAEIIAAHERLRTVKDAIKELEKESEELETAIKIFMKDAEILSDQGQPLFTWKSTKPIRSFDKTAFKAEHPDLYEKFEVEKEGYRRFLIK